MKKILINFKKNGNKHSNHFKKSKDYLFYPHSFIRCYCHFQFPFSFQNILAKNDLFEII